MNVAVVVSAENNPYLEWQTMVLARSCFVALQTWPTVVVHGDGALLPGFLLLRRLGADVQQAMNWRYSHGVDYPPRNTCATLAHVATSAEYLFLCDPDIVFLRAPLWPTVMRDDAITMDEASYLRPNPCNAPALMAACRALNVSPTQLADERLAGGVPHLIATASRADLAREWQQCIDWFLARRLCLRGGSRYDPWLTSMWGLVFAVLRLRMGAVRTRFAALNHRGGGDAAVATAREMIHYAYGDQYFDKRQYHGSRARALAVWRCGWAPQGSMAWQLQERIREAGLFYHGAGWPLEPHSAPPSGPVDEPMVRVSD